MATKYRLTSRKVSASIGDHAGNVVSMDTGHPVQDRPDSTPLPPAKEPANKAARATLGGG